MIALRNSHSGERNGGALMNPACRTLFHCIWGCRNPCCHPWVWRRDGIDDPGHGAHGLHGTQHAPRDGCSSARPHRRHLRSCLQNTNLAFQGAPNIGDLMLRSHLALVGLLKLAHFGLRACTACWTCTARSASEVSRSKRLRESLGGKRPADPVRLARKLSEELDVTCAPQFWPTRSRKGS